MRQLRPPTALTLVGTLAVGLYGCQQSDQELPFELDPTQGQSASVSATEGGTVSVPPNFSIEFFPGTLLSSTTVTALERLAAFPDDAGVDVPGTAYDVGPAGTALSPTAPAKVQILVPEALLAAGEELSLSVALLRSGGSIVTDAISYDLGSGILSAYVDELGPVAAVVVNDGIAIGDIGDIPPLGGGVVDLVSPAPVAGPASAPPPTQTDGVVYAAECSPGERSCFTSGIAKMWVDGEVREHLGDELVLLNTTVEATIEFFSFVGGVPTMAVGYFRIDGDLRARINQVVASREVGDEVAFYTGEGPDPNNPDATVLSVAGGEMTFYNTSQDDDPQVLGFDVSGVGTSKLLTIELSGEIDFDDGSSGQIVAHVRLRK